MTVSCQALSTGKGNDCNLCQRRTLTSLPSPTSGWFVSQGTLVAVMYAVYECAEHLLVFTQSSTGDRKTMVDRLVFGR